MAEFTHRDIKAALGVVANRVKSNNVYQLTPQMSAVNERACEVFTRPGNVYSRIEKNGPKVNITNRSVRKTKRLVRRGTQDVQQMSWDELLKWLQDNWLTILQMLLSLFIFMI